MKQLLLLAVLALLSMHCLAAGDTIGVYFRFNEPMLPAEMAKRLDSALINGPLNRNGKLLIIGHTDALGGESYNLQLSRRRATAVKEFLVGAGVRAKDIQLLTGVGEQNAGIAVDADSRPQDRRVDIVMLAPASLATRPKLRQTDTAVKRFVPAPAAAPVISGARRDSVKFLKELAVGESLVLRNIFFYPGRHQVRPESFPTLDTLLRALLEQPSMVIRVEGHVCCIPANAPDAMDEETFRLELSTNRAEIIRQMLIEQGVEPRRIQAAGYGRRFPVSQNEQNEDEANLNRRVEVRVLSK